MNDCKDHFNTTRLLSNSPRAYIEEKKPRRRPGTRLGRVEARQVGSVEGSLSRFSTFSFLVFAINPSPSSTTSYNTRKRCNTSTQRALPLQYFKPCPTITPRSLVLRRSRGLQHFHVSHFLVVRPKHVNDSSRKSQEDRCSGRGYCSVLEQCRFRHLYRCSSYSPSKKRTSQIDHWIGRVHPISY